MKKLLIFISLALLIYGLWNYYSKTLEINELNLAPLETLKPYTPPASEAAVTNLKSSLPYHNDKFSISWNTTTNQADAILNVPYENNSISLLNWLADHQATNLPLGTINIIKK